ncbi:uncharacterized protein METZ01_LOCUS480430, partial [marine metagenome]
RIWQTDGPAFSRRCQKTRTGAGSGAGGLGACITNGGLMLAMFQ